jgi:dihydrodipicolinate synthase/N-acetylneuraminate lyase
MSVMSRRHFTRAGCAAVAALAATPLRAWAARRPPPGAPGGAKAMRGVFIILTTPFTAAGEVAWDDLGRETAFVDACGCAGVVWPQGSSGVANLTSAERTRGMEVLAAAARGKSAALVLGVQGRDTAEMLEYARRAEALEPDALIAMPPSAARGLDEYRDYFRALAKATSRPVIVQTSGGARDLAPGVDLIVQLAREFPHVAYVKEESAPLVERMKAEARQRPPLKGVFGASLGAGWLYEMRLGLDGVITGMGMYPDLMARIWSMHEKGDAAGVRDAYAKFLLMRNVSQQIPGADLYLFRKRGIFKAMTTRTGGAAAWKAKTFDLTADETAEIDYRFEALTPYLQVTS